MLNHLLIIILSLVNKFSKLAIPSYNLSQETVQKIFLKLKKNDHTFLIEWTINAICRTSGGEKGIKYHKIAFAKSSARRIYYLHNRQDALYCLGKNTLLLSICIFLYKIFQFPNFMLLNNLKSARQKASKKLKILWAIFYSAILDPPYWIFKCQQKRH